MLKCFCLNPQVPQLLPCKIRSMHPTTSAPILPVLTSEGAWGYPSPQPSHFYILFGYKVHAILS